MNYCARCGRGIEGLGVREGKHAFHAPCFRAKTIEELPANVTPISDGLLKSAEAAVKLIQDKKPYMSQRERRDTKMRLVKR